MITLSSGDEAPSDQMERLKKCVKRAGGPREVAKRSGVPLGSLNHYLAGREMKVSSAAAIAKACGVSLNYLATGEELGTNFDLAFLRPEVFDSAANFKGLATVIKVAQRYFKRNNLTPTVGEVFRWMGPFYIGYTDLLDEAGEGVVPPEPIDPAHLEILERVVSKLKWPK